MYIILYIHNIYNIYICNIYILCIYSYIYVYIYMNYILFVYIYIYIHSNFEMVHGSTAKLSDDVPRSHGAARGVPGRLLGSETPWFLGVFSCDFWWFPMLKQLENMEKQWENMESPVVWWFSSSESLEDVFTDTWQFHSLEKIGR